MSVIRDMINKKKEMMAKQNAIDAGQSKVVGMTEDGARIIENGEDKFIVSEGLETGLNKLFAYDYQHRYFTVKDEDGNSKSLDIIVRKKKYPYEEYYKDLALNSFYLGPTKENIEFETNMTGNIYERYIGSQKDLSLNNINVLRYQLKNDMEASYFLDKFVIVTQEERQAYQINAYRVLLTRARQGMIICVPEGNPEDGTRNPKYYDGTFDYLKSIGLEVI